MSTKLFPLEEKDETSSTALLPVKQKNETSSNNDKPSPPFFISEKQLSSYGLKKRESVSIFFREPYIHYAYRPYPSTFKYCLKSLLHPTNETMNVWTHLIPIMFMIYHCWNFISTQIGNKHAFLLYPYWFFIAGVIGTLFGSILAHTFNCLSLGAREVCFCCDYCSIALHAIGFTSAFSFYLCPYTCMGFSHDFSIKMYCFLMFGNVLCVYSSCKTRQNPNIRFKNVIRVLPYLVFFSLLVIPCIRKFAVSSASGVINCTCFTSISPACCHGKSVYHTNLFIVICVCFLLGALVHAIKFPERFFPGRFDVIGHSHQFFHVFTFIGLYSKTLLIESNLMSLIDLQKPGQISTDDFYMTTGTAIIVPISAILLAFFIGLYYSVVLFKMRVSEEVILPSSSKKKN